VPQAGAQAPALSGAAGATPESNPNHVDCAVHGSLMGLPGGELTPRSAVSACGRLPRTAQTWST